MVTNCATVSVSDDDSFLYCIDDSVFAAKNGECRFLTSVAFIS